MAYFINIFKSRYILFGLVKRDLNMKYAKSFLGVAWSLLTPIGLVLIIGSVYSILFGADPKEFIPILFTGLTPWLFISGTADAGTGAFISAEGYIKQTQTNLEIFPLRVTLVNFVNFLYSVAAFFIVYIFISPQLFGYVMLMTIPGVAILFIFGLGVANIVSVVNLSVRDYQPLQALVLQGLFYVTPIIYPKEILAQKGYEFIYKINPAYYLIEVVRIPMTGRGIPPAGIYLTALAIALGCFLISVFIMRRTGRGIVFKL